MNEWNGDTWGFDSGSVSVSIAPDGGFSLSVYNDKVDKPFYLWLNPGDTETSLLNALENGGQYFVIDYDYRQIVLVRHDVSVIVDAIYDDGSMAVNLYQVHPDALRSASQYIREHRHS